ncbi:MAG TPA: TrbI/VirB10 family protein [Candidatus Izemoplasmatales bacterium]|nr:TrbI/VirB10 family protein [Candidatus Omnitrophota bacterium]HRY78715.1 TrbI/VirB10 family protein [Candidatus Izemoplasmatales bacterium]
MELSKKKNPTQVKDTPKPPEPEFFDPAEKTRKTIALGSLFQKHPKWFVIAGVAIFVLALFFFYPKTGKKPTVPQVAQDEKRVLVTAVSMERAIDASVKGKKQALSPQAGFRPERRKRKLDTGIAVFVEKPEKENDPKVERIPAQESKLGISSGTKIPALLSNRVFSFNVEAPVTAVLPKDFSFQDKIVIPKDSRFLGNAAVLKSVDRINVRFDLLIFPDGREIRIRALALSEDGSAGIRGKVDKHTDKKVLKAVGESLIAGVSLFAGGRQTDPYSLEDQMRLNLTQNLSNEAARDLRSSKIDTSVTVEAYTPIQVILLEAV